MPYRREKKFDQMVNEYSCNAGDCTYQIADTAIDSLYFGGRMREFAWVNDFLGVISQASSALWSLNFSSIERPIYTKELCRSIPDNVTTIEIKGAHTRYGGGSYVNVNVNVMPLNLALVPNLQTLIVHYNEDLCQRKDFPLFLQSLEKLTETAPKLKKIVFAGWDNNYPEKIPEKVKQLTRDKILSAVNADNIETCSFYHSNSCTDVLISAHRLMGEEKELPLYLNLFLHHNIPAEIITEILLFNSVMVKNELRSHVDDALESTFHRKSYPCVTQGLLKEHGLFRAVTEEYIESNRHQDSSIQEAYDQRFGLVTFDS